MKKKPKPTVAKFARIGPLIQQVRSLIQSARRAAAASINTLQVVTNFEIGRLIVEHEQQGKDRAAYGKEIMGHLSAHLTGEFGRGFSETNLKLMRQFYLLWADRVARIRQTAPDELPAARIRQTAPDELPAARIRQTAPDELKPAVPKIRQKASDESSARSENPSRIAALPLNLSWSHYVVLLSIDDPNERSFYEIESAQSGWSLRELKRQASSCLYERLALSRDKKRVRRLAEEGHTIETPADVLKSPMVLEFLGLEERPAYSEDDLESALIGKLQNFLLEFGKGFLFESRQKRFTFDGDDYHIDLVFYNRLLRCYVLLDLKTDKLTHQDLGQMQMYVNYYDRHVKTPQENPTIGILLCKRKKNALVELTLPKNAKIYASQYVHILPSKDDLRRQLMEWSDEEESR